MLDYGPIRNTRIIHGHRHPDNSLKPRHAHTGLDRQSRRWLHETVGKEGEDLSRHDKWLCMMYPRLIFLHQLLSEDGVIFVSIGDDELHNLRVIFAGSGTIAHAVLKQNAEDGGNRRFILVEIESRVAREVTAERVRRVCAGYTSAKGKPVEGLGGGFQFCTLSAVPLFDANGAIREDIGFEQLAEFVWFAETGAGKTPPHPERRPPQPLSRDGERGARCPLIGVQDGRAVYLLYNGILQDVSPDGGNVLTPAVLNALPPHPGPKVIYAAACRLSPARLARERIVFKQTPYALEV